MVSLVASAFGTDIVFLMESLPVFTTRWVRVSSISSGATFKREATTLSVSLEVTEVESSGLARKVTLPRFRMADSTLKISV